MTTTSPVSGPTLTNPAAPLPADYVAAMTALFNDCDGLSHAMAKTLAYSAANPLTAGATPVIAVGNVTAAAAGTAPAVTQRGTAAAPIFDFVLPVGAAGTNGTNGTNGAPGTNGTNGSNGSPGAPGNLGTGSTSGNTAAGGPYGVERQIRAWLADRVTTAAFGSTNGDQTFASAPFVASGGGGIGATTRADMVAYTVNGKQPYAFMAAQPMSSGDSVIAYLPVAVAPPSSSGATTSLIPLTASFTTSGASSQSIDGTYYIPLTTSPGAATIQGHVITYSGGPSAGIPVLGTARNGVFVASLSSVIPSGTTLAIGVDPAIPKVGKGIWSPIGFSTTAPTLITAVDAVNRTVTVSPAVVSGAYPTGGGTQNGILAMQEAMIFTPLAEASLASNTTMDHLAFHAAYYSHDQVFYAGVGTNYPIMSMVISGRLLPQPHIVIGGRPVNIIGDGRTSTKLTGSNNDPVVQWFPGSLTYQEMRDYTIDYVGGFADCGMYISGHGYSAYAQNANAGSAIRLANMLIRTPFSGAGARACLKIRNMGNMSLSEMELTAPGKSVALSCGLDLGNVVLCKTNDLNIHYAKIAVYTPLYCEHVSVDRLSLDQCGSAFDNWTCSTFNGQSMLLFDAMHLDTDCSDFVIRLKLSSGFCIGPSNVGGGSSTGSIVLLAACSNGTVIGLNGSAGSSSAPFIQLIQGVSDGGAFDCNTISMSGIIAQNSSYAADISGAHTGINVTADLCTVPAGTGRYQFVSAPVKYTTGSGNKVNGVVV